MNKKKAPAFMFYPSDFLSDENVAIMTNRELGCYIKLICFAWREGSIPLETNKLARLCNENLTDMIEMWPQIEPCFEKSKTEGGRLVHPRLERERQSQAEHSEQKSRAGKAGSSARWNKELGDKLESFFGEPIVPPVTNDNSSLPLPLSPSSNEYTPEGVFVDAKAVVKESAPANISLFGDDPIVLPTTNRKPPLPACPQQEVIELYHRCLPANPRVVTWNKSREGMLRSRWREMSENDNPDIKAGYKTSSDGLAWWKDFLAWCAKSDFLTGRCPPSNGSTRPFVATIDWILSPNNFAKIIEGRYHN